MNLIKEIRQTCAAFPSQWEIEFNGPLVAYVRFRGGVLTVGFGRTHDDAVLDSMNNPPAFQSGNQWAGEMEWSEAEPYFAAEFWKHATGTRVARATIEQAALQTALDVLALPKQERERFAKHVDDYRKKLGLDEV